VADNCSYGIDRCCHTVWVGCTVSMEGVRCYWRVVWWGEDEGVSLVGCHTTVLWRQESVRCRQEVVQEGCVIEGGGNAEEFGNADCNVDDIYIKHK